MCGIGGKLGQLRLAMEIESHSLPLMLVTRAMRGALGPPSARMQTCVHTRSLSPSSVAAAAVLSGGGLSVSEGQLTVYTEALYRKSLGSQPERHVRQQAALDAHVWVERALGSSAVRSPPAEPKFDECLLWVILCPIIFRG